MFHLASEDFTNIVIAEDFPDPVHSLLGTASHNSNFSFNGGTTKRLFFALFSKH